MKAVTQNTLTNHVCTVLSMFVGAVVDPGLDLTGALGGG